MPTIELAGKTLEVDENGFMQDYNAWNQDIARAYAARDGVQELTDEHWRIINFLREFYLMNLRCPMIKKLTAETGFTLKKLYDLFPEGPANSACKWAGVPKPIGCS